MFSSTSLRENFVLESDPRPVQDEAFKFISVNERGVILEIPTGEGKTAIGATCCATESVEGIGPSFYVTPGKTQVGQVVDTLGDDGIVIMGRTDYECLYYTLRGNPAVTAAQSPCYMLKCKHRVNQETGEVEEMGAEPCPYFQAKYEALVRAKSGGTVVTTMAWFLMNRMLVKGWRDLEPSLVVIDEVHRLAGVARAIFEQRLTDTHLMRAADLLQPLQPDEAAKLRGFARKMYETARKHPDSDPQLLPDAEIAELLTVLSTLKADEISRTVRDQVTSGQLDALADREVIKVLESLAHGIPRLVANLRYALGLYGNNEEKLHPLNFVVAYYLTEREEAEAGPGKAHTVLEIKAYFVKGLIQKAIGGAKVVSYSATIGEPDILGFETGLKQPFKSIGSTFSATRTRLYLPTDTPNLAHKVAGRDDWKKALQKTVSAAKTFTARSHRCLVVVTSDKERQYFLGRAERDGLEGVITYGPGLNARVAAERFKDGEGMVLVGTSAHYAEGVDFPGGLAPVTFMLRPSWGNPSDPLSQFEAKRFPKRCWALWRYRVQLEALQVRGRNLRSTEDVGVTFFMSQGFKNLQLLGSLPKWLEPAYRGQVTVAQAVDDALKLLEQGPTSVAAK